MARTPESETLGINVYEQLRAAILQGRFQPGERLRPGHLAEEYGVSPGLVREALTRLAEQRLTVVEPNRGHRVVTIDAQQIRDLVELRRINEVAALRLALARGGPDWEAEVLAAHHRLKAVLQAEPSGSAAWDAAHRDYHLALLRGCGNQRLVALCDELFVASDLYRRWAAAADRVGPSDRPHRPDEHADILEAVLAHDVERAVHLYDAHLERTADLATYWVEPAAGNLTA